LQQYVNVSHLFFSSEHTNHSPFTNGFCGLKSQGIYSNFSGPVRDFPPNSIERSQSQFPNLDFSYFVPPSIEVTDEANKPQKY
jgi:hypothetical protein